MRSPSPPASPASLPATPRSRLYGPTVWRAIAIVVVALYLLRLSYFVFHDLADGMAGMIVKRVFEETTGAIASAPFIVVMVLIGRRMPLAWMSWQRGTLIYGGVFVLFALTETLAMLMLRAASAPLFGLSGYALRLQPSRFAYESVNDALPYIACLAGFTLAEVVLERRERERRAAALEHALLEAELRNLRLQLQPHFLFNALNTISSTMYENVEEADALLGQLAELLRTSLRSTHAHEVPLRDEIALLAQYLGLMHARFGDRLSVSVDADDAAADCLVPSMVLQPLVENAVRHGAIAQGRHGEVRVTARRVDGEQLELRVHDDGPGISGGREPLGNGEGTGLSTAEQRLHLLYGSAGALVAANAPEGGFAVTLRIPVRLFATGRTLAEASRSQVIVST
jgi:sensor histidine kinase YesM